MAETGFDLGLWPKYDTIALSKPDPHILRVTLNRPKKRNAMNMLMWKEYRECFEQIQSLWMSEDRPVTDLRCVVVDGEGQMFTTGLDLFDAMPKITPDRADVSRVAYYLRNMVKGMQETFNAMEKCPVPVITVVHGGCVGAGMDLITASDIRVCSKDAWFSVKEVDIGLAADVGTLQRFPKVVGNDSLVRELALTGRSLPADEALQCGLVSHVAADKEAAMKHALSIARTIADRSPIAVYGTKQVLNYSRDHPVVSGLEYVATWNAAMLQSVDLPEAASSFIGKKVPKFSSL